MGGKGQRESRTEISIAACTDEHVNASWPMYICI